MSVGLYIFGAAALPREGLIVAKEFRSEKAPQVSEGPPTESVSSFSREVSANRLTSCPASVIVAQAQRRASHTSKRHRCPIRMRIGLFLFIRPSLTAQRFVHIRTAPRFQKYRTFKEGL